MMPVSGLSHSCFLCAPVIPLTSPLQPGKPTPWTEGELTSLPSVYPTQRRSPFRPSGLTCCHDFTDHPPCFQLFSYLFFWNLLFQNSPNFRLSEHYWVVGGSGKILIISWHKMHNKSCLNCFHSRQNTVSQLCLRVLFLFLRFLNFWLPAACRLSLVAVSRFLIEVASLVAEHGL